MAVTMVFAITGCSKEEKELAEFEESQEEGLESAVETYEGAGFTFIDETEDLDDETKEAYTDEAKTLLEAYLGKIFNVNASTKDYTEKLMSYYGEGDYFVNSNSDVGKNAFTLMQGIHQESEFKSLELNQVILRRDKVVPELGIVGNIRFSGKSDNFEQGDYAAPFSCIILNIDGEWKLYGMQINQIYKDEGFAMILYPEKGENAIASKGVMVDAYDFANIEGYLHDYDYSDENHTFNEKDYDVVE